MQQLRMGPDSRYASLGWRALAVLIDTVVIGAIFVVVLGVAQAAGALHLDAYRGANPFAVSVPKWAYVALYGLLFIYYTAFELTRGATPGKMALGMRVTAADGSTAGVRAVVLRNLVRIPEAILYYLPAAVACMASAKRQRLGDLAARTVVLRRAPVVAAPPQMAMPTAATPPPQTSSWAASAQAASAAGRTMEERLDEALDALNTAALSVRGAHHNFLRLSEREIERGGGVSAEFSPEYAAAWHTLADAVVALQHANTEAAQAAAHAGTSLPQAAAARLDLRHLRDIEPYFTAGSDEAVQEAYLTVARREAAEA